MDNYIKDWNGGAETGEAREESEQVEDQFEEQYEVMGQEQYLDVERERYLDREQELLDLDMEEDEYVDKEQEQYIDVGDEQHQQTLPGILNFRVFTAGFAETQYKEYNQYTVKVFPYHYFRAELVPRLFGFISHLGTVVFFLKMIFKIIGTLHRFNLQLHL